MTAGVWVNSSGAECSSGSKHCRSQDISFDLQRAIYPGTSHQPVLEDIIHLQCFMEVTSVKAQFFYIFTTFKSIKKISFSAFQMFVFLGVQLDVYFIEDRCFEYTILSFEISIVAFGAAVLQTELIQPSGSHGGRLCVGTLYLETCVLMLCLQ